jgi:hypothetical protein
MAGQRRDNLVGDGFDIERFGQCGHAWTLSEVLEGANGYKSASRAPVRSWPATLLMSVFAVSGTHVAISRHVAEGHTRTKSNSPPAPYAAGRSTRALCHE